MPHLCARHVSTFHIYNTIASLAAIYPDEAIFQETLNIFKLLLDSEEGDFLRNKGFADALIGFISTITSAIIPVDLEAKVVEVLFSIAAKLRSDADLLPTWFRPRREGWAFPSSETQLHMEKEDFPLFYLTLDYVHHDGRAGDFARTGLLYLIESAAHSTSLEQWIIESDLATLMASGLGALYSQLSRKLVLDFDGDFSSTEDAVDIARPRTPVDAEKTTSPQFKAHLATFLSYLVFWQDVLEHCSSSDVKRSLLDHFKFLFLQQLLYPSLIESSDRDGGSSVAVLTYLKCIIESIDHPDLVQLTFEYLLAIPEAPPEDTAPIRPTSLARRRTSQNLIASLSQGQEKPLPDLFNLDDLVLGSLGSNNQQTVTATLRLISTMLRSHHQYDVSLIKTSKHVALEPRSLDVQEQNLAILRSVVQNLMHNPDLPESYEVHLEDAQNLLEGHACSLQLLALPDFDSFLPSNRLQRGQSAMHANMKFDDPILQSLIALLEDFLVNEVDTNLSLTYAFSTIASCARRGLNDWLLETSDTIETPPPAEKAVGSHKPRDLSGSAEDPAAATEPPSNQGVKTTTPVFAALERLVKQVESLRQRFDQFDNYLLQHRTSLKQSETSQHSKTDPHYQQTSEESARIPHRSTAPIGSISQRLASETSTAIGSNASSPRGRPLDAPSPTLVGRLNHLRLSPSRKPSPNQTSRNASPSTPAVRNISPSPLRNDMVPDQAGTDEVDVPSEPRATANDPFQQKIKIKIHRASERDLPDVRSEASSVRSSSMTSEPVEQFKEVTLSHVMTNIVILQEFVLELLAIVEVRASLFGEVRFEKAE